MISRRWAIFSITAMMFFLSQFYRTSLAVITPQLTEDLAVGPDGLSLLSAIFFYSFALTQIPIGMFLDRVGPRATMTILSIIGVFGALTFAWSETVSTAATGRLLLGIGMACNFMGSLKLITTWFSPRWFATLSAVFVSIGMAGNLVSSTPLVLMVRWMGWRYSFTCFAFFSTLLTIVFYLVARDRPERAASKDAISQTASDITAKTFSAIAMLFQMKDYWIISFGTFCRYGIFAAVQALWAGPYLMNALGFDPVMAGNILFLLTVGSIAGGPFFGVVSDRYLKSRKDVVMIGFAGMVAVLSILGFVPAGTGYMAPMALFFLFGFFAAAGGVMYAHIKESLPIEMAGTAMTGINFFTMTGAAVFLQGIGKFMSWLFPLAAMDAASFRWAFFGLAGVLCCAAGLYAATRETLRAEG